MVHPDGAIHSYFPVLQFLDVYLQVPPVSSRTHCTRKYAKGCWSLFGLGPVGRYNCCDLGMDIVMSEQNCLFAAVRAVVGCR